jgi:hypothetical protein
VSAEKRLIRWPEERVLEDVAYGQQATPTRIFAILLPVWRVTIKATVTDGEPYDLIDRYLERGLAQADLHTGADLARFLGLDEVVIDRALRFLAAIGHVTVQGGQVTLTELGYRSVRDGRRYVVTRQDRRTLYFDGFGSRPLTRPYYDTRTVALLSAAEAVAATGTAAWPRFTMLYSRFGFRPEALTELAGHPDRDHFNLPERIDNPEPVESLECLFLPTYVVRAVQPGGRVAAGVRLFAYTQATNVAEADLDVSDLCERTPDIAAVLAVEESSLAAGTSERLHEWMRGRSAGGSRAPQIRQLDNGAWQATLPASSFGGDAAFSISKVGSFIVRHRDVLHLWCADPEVRRQALLERIDNYLSSRARPDRAQTEERLTQIARQLDLGPMDLPALRRQAAESGRTGLAAHLDTLMRAS